MPKLLVLGDSDPLRLTVLEEACRTAGFEVSPVMDGEQVLASVARQPPALVVLASELPRLDGLSVLRILKKEAQLRTIPVLVIAAAAADAAAAKAIGAEGVLEPPLEVVRVQAKVRSTLKKARERSQARRRALSMEQLEAALDPESGASTRAHLLLSLDYEHAGALRYGRALGCLVVDVLGLPEGDERRPALRAVVAGLTSVVGDLIFRAAEARFVALVRDGDAAEIARLAERLRSEVAVPGVTFRVAGAAHPDAEVATGAALLSAAAGKPFA